MAPVASSSSSNPKAAAKPVAAEKAVRSKAKDASDAVVTKVAAAKNVKAAAVTAPKAAAAAAAAAPPKAAAAPAAPVVAAADVVVHTVKPSAAIKLVDAVDGINGTLSAQDALIKQLLDNARLVRKMRESISRFSANAKKAEGVRVEKALKKKANGNPTGLKQPALASDALNAFLGNPAGTEVRRADAAASIRAYIALHKLKEGASAGGNARVDAVLDKLFTGIPEIKIFNIQSHLKNHFAKKEKVVPVVVAV